MINIQSVSDLITNSSTEVFIVYEEGNINSIKELVNSILSLNGDGKTFDDYFTIEMSLNYDDLEYAMDALMDNDESEEKFPEIIAYKDVLDDYKERDKYLHSIPKDRMIDIIEAANEYSWSNTYRAFDGFVIKAKSNDPIIEKVASVINGIDSIFEIDYEANY